MAERVSNDFSPQDAEQDAPAWLTDDGWLSDDQLTTMGALDRWRQLITASTLSTAEKMVAHAIGGYLTQRKMQAWPSAPTLAGDTSLSVRQVWRCIKSLEAAGWLLVGHQGRKRGARTKANRYVICLPAEEPGAPWKRL